MAGRYYIKTFGCQMNEYDSARMADVLRAHVQLTPTEDPEAADLLLMNTCSVREKAQEKVFSLLGEWREIKSRRPGVIIAVGGCVACQGPGLRAGAEPHAGVAGGRLCQAAAGPRGAAPRPSRCPGARSGTRRRRSSSCRG